MRRQKIQTKDTKKTKLPPFVPFFAIMGGYGIALYLLMAFIPTSEKLTLRQNYLFFSVVFFSLFISVIAVAKYQDTVKILDKKTKTVGSEELRKEDDVVLQAVAFSQSTFFIYLNLVPENYLSDILKVLVPVLAIIFYSIRGWAKITNSNRLRYWSVWILFFVILNFFIWSVHALLEPIVGIWGLIIWIGFNPFLYAAIFAIPLMTIKTIFKKRYAV